MGWFKKLRRAGENFIKAPMKIATATAKGDIKKAAGIAVNPFAGQQSTRDRNLRRAGGVVTGAAAGFVTGGPAGAVAGGVIGGARAGKGKGKLKDYAKTAVIGFGAGAVVGAGAGAMGFEQYGGMAGKWGAGMMTKTAAPAVDAVSSGGSSWWGTAEKVLTVGSMGMGALQGQPQAVEEPYMAALSAGPEPNYPEPMYPISYGYDGPAYRQADRPQADSDLPVLLLLGVLIVGLS